MFNSFFKLTLIYLIIIFISVLFVSFSIFQVSILTSNTLETGDYIWPLPGNTYISSYFGHRVSPTSGASSYHSGIDIPASEGTNILSICDGIVTFASWGAGGGYTIVIENSAVKVSYCHLSPNFIVVRGDIVKKGEIISNVGPKNVYGIENNPYRDSYGNPTNGATTRLSFTFNYKKRRHCRQSFRLYI